jgi:hypothetical protein
LAEVGYINILNGIEPAKAFVIERRGSIIKPEGVYTDLEKDDVVKPAAEALLLFTPSNTACAVVEIQGQFTATACSAPPGSITDMVYDFVIGKFLAVPQKRVGTFATRGTKDERVHSLPPQALRLFVESTDLADSLRKTPFIALTEKKSEAEALILGQGVVQLLSPGAISGLRFQLPTEGTALRQALLRRINFKTMAELVSSNPWPAVEWSINIHAPVTGGPLKYDARQWAIVKTTQVKADQVAPISVKRPSVLTFKLVNHSDKSYYVYLVNYTDEGQVLPFLPIQDAPQWPNLLEAGKELPLGSILLELTSTKEYVRLIISENPLDLGQFNQESLEVPAETVANPGRLRPVPENSWATLSQEFELK